MTRKDYELIAQAIHRTGIASKIGKKRFLKAAGFPEQEPATTCPECSEPTTGPDPCDECRAEAEQWDRAAPDLLGDESHGQGGTT